MTCKIFSFNLVRPEIILREYFFDEILLDEKKRITVVASLCLPGDDVHTLSEIT